MCLIRPVFPAASKVLQQKTLSKWLLAGWEESFFHQIFIGEYTGLWRNSILVGNICIKHMDTLLNM